MRRLLGVGLGIVLVAGMAPATWTQEVQRWYPPSGTEFERWARSQPHKARYKVREWAWKAWSLEDPSRPWIRVGRFIVSGRTSAWHVVVSDRFGHSVSFRYRNTTADVAAVRAQTAFLRMGHGPHGFPRVTELRELPSKPGP